MVCNGQILDALQQINSANRRLSELRQNADNLGIVGRRSLVKDYRNGDLALILKLGPARNREPMGARLSRSPRKACDIPMLILYFQAMQERDIQHWNQEPMFVRSVQYVNGPNGIIPSTVRLYIGDYEVVKGGTSHVYLSLFERIFQKLTGRINREAVLFGNGYIALDHGSNPSVVEGASHVVNCVADYQSQTVNDIFSFSKAIHDELGLSILMEPRTILIGQSGNNSLEVADMLVGPFYF